MDLTAQLHLAAGASSIALGTGALLAAPRRTHNRLFALLCCSLALWNLGLGVARAWDPGFRLDVVYLLGSCAAAPLTFHLSLALMRRVRVNRTLVVASYSVAALLWLSVWTPFRQPEFRVHWNVTAMAVLGTILFTGISFVAVHVARLPWGPARRAFLLYLVASVIATVGGLSDFLPRDLSIPRFGPITVMLALLVLCAMVVHYRFWDVNHFLLRAVTTVSGAAAASLLLLGLIRVAGSGYVSLLVGCVLVLTVSGPVGRWLHAGATSLLAPRSESVRVLAGVSGELARATTSEEWRAALDTAARALPGNARLGLLRATSSTELTPAFASGEPRTGDRLTSDRGLGRLLAIERRAVTPDLLGDPKRLPPDLRDLASEALDELEALGADVVTPLHHGDRLAGLALVGGLPRSELTGELAVTLVGFGQQALTALDRIEALEAARRSEALAAVGEMAAGLAHEVRNPLAAIRGAAQVVRDATAPAQAEEMLEVIDEESARLGRVVGEFLDYARPDSPRREPVELTAVLERVARAARAADGAMAVELQGPDGALTVLADPDQLQRAFGNLVQNAREAAASRVTLAVEALPASAAVRVTDDGSGIPEDEVGLVFHPFHTRRDGGTGLGLALVHRVVEAHGGRVTVESRAGAGTTFTVELPSAGRNAT